MTKLIKIGTTLCLAAVGMLTLSQLPAKAEYSADEKKQIAELKKSYPLTTCPVTGNKLEGPMGGPIDYLYQQKTADDNETTRLVRFCCPDCIKKFNKDTERYSEIIDAAAAKKGVTTPSSTPPRPSTPAPSSNSGEGMSGMSGGCH